MQSVTGLNCQGIHLPGWTNERCCHHSPERVEDVVIGGGIGDTVIGGRVENVPADSNLHMACFILQSSIHIWLVD